MLRQLLTTILFCSVFGAFTASSQFVIVNSPNDIAGSYTFTNSWANAWGVDLTTGTWTADLVAVVGDGTSGFPTNEGCDSLVNGMDVAGKIAIVDRGSCNFSLKALNAQKAGAIACVIVNNTPGGPAGMGGGDFAAEVMIPVVMIGLEDGDIIKAAMAMGAVNMTIGNVQFPNNVGAPTTDFLRAQNGVTPAVQYDADPFAFTPGAIVTNFGANTASNIVVNAKITHTPIGGGSTTDVYDESAAFADPLETDSSVLLTTDDFIATEGMGIYDVTYTISSDSMDQVDNDNSNSSQMILSENFYCKGGWDFANSRPARTNAYTIAGGGNIEFLTGFRMPMGVGYKLESFNFYVATNAASLDVVGASNITAYVYRWDDANDDNLEQNDEISIVGFGEVTGWADGNATAEWLTIPVLDFDDFEPGYIVPEDDNVYFVGVRYQGPELVFFGFDEAHDQSVYADFIAPTLVDLPYFFVDTWTDLSPDIEGDAGIFTDFWGSCATALIIDQANGTGEVNPEIGTFEVYPNPTTELINVETNLAKAYDKVDYTVVDNNGKVVSILRTQGQGNTAQIDVSTLPAGQYYLNVNTTDGSTSKAFSVQR